MDQMTRLPLMGTVNTRELGGIPVIVSPDHGGYHLLSEEVTTGAYTEMTIFQHLPQPVARRRGVTAWHQFLRSDGLQDLTPEDLDYLHEYGITQIIDLRSPAELAQAPDPVRETFTYFNVSLMVAEVADITASGKGAKDHLMNIDLGDFYIQLLDQRRDHLRLIFELMAENVGGTLFHCAAGKDRTGVVAALLLELAGAQTPDIIANYQTTHTFLAPKMAATHTAAGYDPALLRSDAENISRLLDHLAESYGTAYDYLRQAGMSRENLRQLQQKTLNGSLIKL